MVRSVTESAPVELTASSAGQVSALSIIRGSWSELGEILEPHLSRWPQGDRVGDALREGLAIPSRRRPEDYAAILLMRLDDKLELPGLSAFFSKPIDPKGNAGQLHKLVDALDSIASMPLRSRAEALQAQIKALATSKLEPPAVSTEAVALVRGVKTKSDLPRVEFGALASSLAYGGSKAIALIEEEMRRDPDGRFAFAVRSSGYRADAFPGEKLGDLILLLSRYRSRHDPRELDGEALAASFGDVAPRLLAVLDDLSRAPIPKEPNLMALGQMIAQLGKRLPQKKAKELADELVRRPELIPKSNPVLDRVLPHIPDGTLAGQGLIAVQHLLPSVCNLIEASIKKGMRPDQIHVLATPYNCNPLVASYLELLGVHVQRSMSFGLESRGSEHVRAKEIDKFIADSFRGEPPRAGWRVLDDGGLLHVGLDRSKESRHLAAIRSSTEQTTRGLTEIRKLTRRFPVFTVANQPGKELEGLVVGGVLAQSMYRELVQSGRDATAKRILNISAGTIGLESARQLRRAGYDVDLYDLDPTKREKARQKGFDKEVIDALPDDLNAYDAILSSTGRRALHLLKLVDFRGLIGSGSSTMVEFDGQMLGPLGGQLNRSHPLNFTGTGYERLTAEQIGATISLLFLGVCADDRGLPPTEHDVNHDLEKIAVDAWMELGGSKVSEIDRSTKIDIARPDEVSPAPTHDEWMTYLANLPRAVTPRPNSVGFVEGVYFFAGDRGEVRCVDTRSGLSFEAPELDKVPERIAPGGYPKERYPMLLFDPRTEPYATVRVARAIGGRLELSPPEAVERSVSHYYFEKGQFEMEQGLVFERDDRYLVYWPGRWDQPEWHPKPFGADTMAIMESSKRLVCLHRQLGALKTVGEPQLYPIAQPIVNVKQFLRAKPYNDLLAVGSSASGKPAVGLLGHRGWHAYELPEGAIVHDVYWPGDMYRFKVTYTLPGEPVEPENLKEVEFMPLGRDLPGYLPGA